MSVAWTGRHALISLACFLASTGLAWAAEKEGKPERLPRHPAISPGEALPEGWEKLDPRYERLVLQLGAVNEELKALIGKQYSNKHGIYSEKAKAKQADASIIRQWANGGGPISWTRFYGRTIDAFYHPGPSRAAAVFDGWGNVGVTVSQGSPTLKERPPQFDYIVKAQEKIKADALARADELAKKTLPEIEARRRELEAKHIKLSCQIAFHEVKRRDLANKQLYRFKPVSRSVDSESRQNEESMYTVVILMSKVVRIVDRGEEHQGWALQEIAKSVEQGRVELADTWARQQVIEASVSNDSPDLTTPQGRFIALTRFLEDHAANLDESYADAISDSQAKVVSSLVAKTERWDQLWESLVGFAQAVLAMDETAIALAGQWRVQPDLSTPLVLKEEVVQPRDAKASPATTSPGVSSSSFDLSRLREIKIRQRKGKKWDTLAVGHNDGGAYIKRDDGSKVPLVVERNSLSWQGPKGGERKVNTDQMTTASGQKVRFIVAD